MLYTSPLIAAGSGSVAGCTFSRNRSGQYIRNRSVPTNPSTSFQQIMRGALATLVARWTDTLTPAQREDWTTWAVNTPQTNPLGFSFNLTGQQAYVKMNAARIQAGITIVDAAPTTFSGAPLTPATSFVADAAEQDITFAFTNTDEWATAVGGFLAVFISRPQNPSVNFYKGPFLFAGTVLGAVVPPTSPAAIDAPFPFVVGQRVFVRLRAATADARISTSQFGTALAV
jgi:hypothetical protein